MAGRFFVTYELVTPESAEHGDAAERGFYTAGGGRDPLDLVTDRGEYAMDLRSALRLCVPVYDCGRWFDSHSETECFRTGAELQTSLHPPGNITAASYARLKRLLNVRH